jgi:CRISPR/Cas system-associated endonuclease Cas1
MQPTRPLGQVRIAIAAEAGLDPAIGYLHVCQPGRQALVCDLMEPYRPEVDRAVLDFIRRQAFTPRDFVIDAKGVCRLHPELARTLCERVTEECRASAGLVHAAACLRDSDCEAGTGVKRYVVAAE